MDIKLQETVRLVVLSSAAARRNESSNSSDRRRSGRRLGSGERSIIGWLLKKIDELEAVQKRMQDKLDRLTAPAAAAPSALPTAVDESQAAPEMAAADPAAGESHALGPIEFRGFSDFDYGRAWFEKLPPGGLQGSPHSFNIGDFDLFTNTRISEHWSVLGEMLVTSDFTNNFAIEMDRLLFTYKPSEYFAIGFGKFNTALGYYPNAFHRARYFQTATSRPIMYSDEDNGGLLPVHNIGITTTGKISGALGLHWVAEVSNGRSATDEEAPIQNFVDESNGKAVNFALYAQAGSGCAASRPDSRFITTRCIRWILLRSTRISSLATPCMSAPVWNF